MVPQTDIIYNYEYARRLYRGPGHFEDVWRRIIGLGADFEKICEELNDYILELIERHTGFAWGEYSDEIIHVYMVDSQPSFAQPLTLSVNEDRTVMLREYIQQLVHRNMYFGFTTNELRDRCLETVTDQIMAELHLADQGKNGWDVRQKTIREYLKK